MAIPVGCEPEASDDDAVLEIFLELFAGLDGLTSPVVREFGGERPARP
jgi:hypothetical protein